MFPVHVSGKSDEQAAVRLAEMLNKKDLGHAEAVHTDLKLDIKPNTNQARIVWDIARAFQDFLCKHPPAADYALLADYGIGRTADGKTAGWRRAVLPLRSQRRLGCGRGPRNSHHPDFQRINPQSPDDCNRLVVEALGNDLR